MKLMIQILIGRSFESFSMFFSLPGNQCFRGQELTEARAARCSSTHLGELARLMRGDSVKLVKLEYSTDVWSWSFNWKIA